MDNRIVISLDPQDRELFREIIASDRGGQRTSRRPLEEPGKARLLLSLSALTVLSGLSLYWILRRLKQRSVGSDDWDATGISTGSDPQAPIIGPA